MYCYLKQKYLPVDLVSHDIWLQDQGLLICSIPVDVRVLGGEARNRGSQGPHARVLIDMYLHNDNYQRLKSLQKF